MSFSFNLLKGCSFFSDLEEENLSLVVKNLEEVVVEEGEYLFHENEEGSALFILSRGKLVVERQEGASLQNFGVIRQGDVVGELSLFSNEPRSASIRALYRSVLFKFTQEKFHSLCMEHPSLLWNISSVIAKRAQKSIKRAKVVRNEVIGLVTVGDQSLAKLFLEKLKENNLEKFGVKIVEISELPEDREHIDPFKSLIEQGYIVIYSFHYSEFTQNASLIKFSDKILVAVDEESNLSEVRDFIGKSVFAETVKVEIDLILVHKKFRVVYENTRQYLDLTNFFRHFHVALDTPNSIQRILKFLSGNALGLVLSGGAARGWGSVGALRAIFERDLCIDYVCGTSIGAFIAAGYAISGTQEEFCKIVDLVGKLTQKPFALKNMTFPVMSLFSGKNEMKLYKHILGDILIEDLNIPYFCVSTDLSAVCEYVWDRGPIWKAVKASSAIPGIFPPCSHDSHLHIDGGILNNFPADVLHKAMGYEGFIIGIDSSAEDQTGTKYTFPDTITLLDSLKIKLGLFEKPVEYVGIPELILKVLCVNASIKRAKNTGYADLLIRPKLERFRFTDFSKKTEMTQIGYEEAKKQLDSDPNLKSFLEKSD